MDKLKLSVVAATLLLAGCVSLAPEYQAPELPIPQQFSRANNRLVPQTHAYQDTGWHTFFVDPQLRRLIDEALRNNRDLRMATLKMQEARAQYRVTDADRYPQLNGASQGSYSGSTKGDGVTERQYQAGIDLSFELDLFGKLKNLSEADRQNFLASQEAVHREAERREHRLQLVEHGPARRRHARRPNQPLGEVEHIGHATGASRSASPCPT